MSNVSSRSWRSQFGFYLLAIGSACSLGNLWRFPYIVGENGGGAFVLLYMLLAFVVGAPLLLAELMMGKKYKKSFSVASRHLLSEISQKNPLLQRTQILNFIPMLLSLTVLSYYSVISGWALHFVNQFVLSLFRGSLRDFVSMSTLVQSNFLQWLLASVHLLLVIVVVAKGAREGLEKRINALMPLFVILVIALMVKSFSTPSSDEVLRFLFYPDFSKLNSDSLAKALGQVFFTLSVGFGSLVTFGSYLRDEDHVPTLGFRVVFIDLAISLVALFLIYPIAFQATNRPISDPALLFEVIPQYFAQLSGGLLYGLLFFLYLYLSALNASIGLLESISANISDRFKVISKRQATILAGVVGLVISIFPTMNFRGADGSSVAIMDNFLVNWMLPISALGIGLLFHFGTTEASKKELYRGDDSVAQSSLNSLEQIWEFLLKWAVPILIVIAVLAKFF